MSKKTQSTKVKSDKKSRNIKDEKTRDPFARVQEKRPPFHYLSNIDGYVAFQVRGNLHYQMQYSVKTLEEQLAAEGKPHVLQLNAFSFKGAEGEWRAPDRWYLYADGLEVARGTAAQARICFEESAEMFRDLCREAIEAAGLDELTKREYQLLCRSRDIARFEPFDSEPGIVGSRLGRV